MDFLKEGQTFIPSVRGHYNFLYPDSSFLSQDSAMVALGHTYLKKPLNIKHAKQPKELTPYMVSESFAYLHSLKYKMIWIKESL